MKNYALSRTCLQTKIVQYFGRTEQLINCQHCYLCLKRKIELTRQEKDFIKKLEAINQLYLNKIDSQKLPNLFTIKQMELMAILQPKSLEDLQRIPGVGSDIINFYANHRISG
jgi:tRNA U34 5-carboxymethylaminomethyl modifying enzyme MnmG/GidA